MNKNISVNVQDFRFGDILLFSTKQPKYIYEELETKIGKFLTEILYQQSGQKYIHQEILLQGTYTLQQTFNGVYILKRNLEDFKYITVRRHKNFKQINKEEFFKVITKYWNLPYDFSSLQLNAIQSFFQQLPMYEQFIQNLINYENNKLLICSETIQRIYEDLGLKVHDDKQEFVSPQNLYDSPYFETIYEQNI